MEIKTFNTKRQYTAKGQRIAFAVLSTGNVLMVDVDRGIEYILACSPNQSAVMAAYDDSRAYPRPGWNDAEYKESLRVMPDLLAAAKAL